MQMNNKKTVVIRVYFGNKGGVQQPWFQHAIGDVMNKIRQHSDPICNIIYEHKTIDVLRDRDRVDGEKVPVQFLTNWLLDSSIHYIVTHPHQGKLYTTSSSFYDFTL